MTAPTPDVFSMLDPRSTAVLERLYAEARDQAPPDVPGAEDAADRAGAEALIEAQIRAFDDQFLSLDRDQAAYCYLQARATGARTVVEFGTSLGLSTIWLAAAVRDNGGGTVIGTERVRAKAERARTHLQEAGLDQYVDIRLGDARETLRGLDGPVDLLLNDGFPDAALDVHRLVAPAMRAGAVVITDNVGLMPEQYAAYLAWLRDPANGFVSVQVPFHGGTEISVRTT
ncbi:O-methyltransferase [Pseudonocardia endophytica]|uniref:Putative O-methyltransferase YrrM n=1 Tax=Pseudonocardia endophytica TaxID=401976 RepID=A0A4R1HIU7_PSEEN|nr:class I SAM-dependent methyltransferase [Pseudonocardia endophytica]TCK22187.1 putative O-methyltransferase YrrM [Pseudonocardia endophytica]